MSGNGARSGFTLLETMIAVMLVGVVAAALLQLVAAASLTSLKDRAYTRGMALAERQIEQVASNAAVGVLEAGSWSGEFDPPDGGYRYRLEVAPVRGLELFEVAVGVTWEAPAPGTVELVTRVVPWERPAP